MGMVSAAARRFALLFPGQGSQKVGMGREVSESSARAREVFRRADGALGFTLSRICFEGPEEKLRLTATTQPALLATSIAILEAMKERVPGGWMDRVTCVAGHSLGEYSALVAAGVLELDDAVRTVRRRGEYMQAAVPVGQGGMAAVMGAPSEKVKELCGRAANGEVLELANLNAPDQTVVAGHAGAVDRLVGLAKGAGVRRVIRLPVSAPFHCSLMTPVRESLGVDLDKLELKDAVFPVITNVDARPVSLGGELREALRRQVTAPVRWVETIRQLKEIGVTTIIEVGPGRVLTGLAKRTEPDLEVINIEDSGGIDAAAAIVSGSPEEGQ